MIKENYINCILETINTYSMKYKKHLLTLFKDANIECDAIFNKNLKTNNIEMTESELLYEKIKYCINNNPSTIEIFKKWEINKEYKYSVFLNSNDFEQILLKAESMFNNQENIGFDVSKNKQNIILKQSNFYCDNYNKSREIEYPIIIVIHKKYQIIEMRFDSLDGNFLELKKKDNFYLNIIKNTHQKLEDLFQVSLVNLNLEHIVEPLIKNHNNNSYMHLVSQYMLMPNGGNAQLDIGKQDTYEMPILGDLKKIIKEYSNDLEKVPLLKNALDTLVYEADELSTYPFIVIRWENEVKSKCIDAKFTFSYKNSNYCVVTHYATRNAGEEMMDCVTKYVSENKYSPKRE